MKKMNFRIADTPADQAAALKLVTARYCDRGYEVGALAFEAPETVVLAEMGGELAATLTLRTEGRRGLAANAVFGPEIELLRETAANLVEVGRFASNTPIAPADLARFFMFSAQVVADADGEVDFVIEVNPRHHPFYERRLGFRAVSEIRTCPRVGAPAVLMHLHVDELPRRATAQLMQHKNTPVGISHITNLH